MVVKWRWNVRVFAPSSDLPEFLRKGKRGDKAHGDSPELPGYLGILGRSGPRQRCLGEGGREWLSFIGCSGYDGVAHSSSGYEPGEEKLDG